MPSQKTYIARKAIELCVNCDKRNSTHFAMCLHCRKQSRKQKGARRQERIRKENCERCGKKHEEQTARCGSCKDHARDVMRGIREKRFDASLCTECGKKPRPHGEMMCNSCRAACKRRRKSRDVIR